MAPVALHGQSPIQAGQGLKITSHLVPLNDWGYRFQPQLMQPGGSSSSAGRQGTRVTARWPNECQLKGVTHIAKGPHPETSLQQLLRGHMQCSEAHQSGDLISDTPVWVIATPQNAREARWEALGSTIAIWLEGRAPSFVLPGAAGLSGRVSHDNHRRFPTVFSKACSLASRPDRRYLACSRLPLRT